MSRCDDPTPRSAAAQAFSHVLRPATTRAGTSQRDVPTFPEITFGNRYRRKLEQFSFSSEEATDIFHRFPHWRIFRLRKTSKSPKFLSKATLGRPEKFYLREEIFSESQKRKFYKIPSAEGPENFYFFVANFSRNKTSVKFLSESFPGTEIL